MAKDRIISRDSHPLDAPVEAESSGVMRPSSLGDYIGQPELKERLTIALDAARQRSDPMEHTLLHGPPGLGKTTLRTSSPMRWERGHMSHRGPR